MNKLQKKAGKEFFRTEGLEPEEHESLLLDVLATVFYLPKSILNAEGVRYENFKMLRGEEAQAVLLDAAEHQIPVHGDISLHNLHYCRGVAISERSFHGVRFFVYKVWHPGKPLNPTTHKEYFDDNRSFYDNHASKYD